MMRALDLRALWQACVQLVTHSLPCHSCTLMYDIKSGYRPQRSLHYLGPVPDGTTPPARSLDVAAPYLARNPRIPWYTLSQIAAADEHARRRLRAQNPAPGWREFIHMAFWGEDGLDAVLSIRIRQDHKHISSPQQQFLGELHPLMGAGLQRIHLFQDERRTLYQALLDRQVLPDLILDHELSPVSLAPSVRKLCADWAGDEDTATGLPAAITSALHDWLSTGPATPLVLRHPARSGADLHISLKQCVQVRPGQALYLLRMAAGQPDPEPACDTRRHWSRLSPSECRVAGLVVDGLRNEEIANHLGRSRKTIESQISAIYRKLDVDHRAQLVRLLATSH